MNELTDLVFVSGPPQSDTDIRYLSSFTAPDPFIFLQSEKGNCLVVSAMEKGRADREAKPGTEVFTPADLGLTRRQGSRLDRQIIALMQRAGLRRIKVPADFPAGLYEKLKRRGIKISVLAKPACSGRSVKSRSEIAHIRESQRAAVAAMNAAVALIASSRIGRGGELSVGGKALTSEAVRRLIHITLMERGCTGQETIVAGGEQATDPHERGYGPLYAGRGIIIDIFPRNDRTGYWGDITRTVCRGTAPAELRRMYLAVKSAQAAALREVRPGVSADAAHTAAKELFGKRGFVTARVNGRHSGFIHGTGHGVGLDIHERPRVGTSGEILEPGNVITVEPGLYYPGIGGVRIEDTVVVTDQGWRYLASCKKKFEWIKQ